MTHSPVAPRSEESEMEYWLGVLQAQIPTVMEKAIASENHAKGARQPDLVPELCRASIHINSKPCPYVSVSISVMALRRHGLLDALILQHMRA